MAINWTVTFDEGHVVEVELTSRDMLKLEKDGVNPEEGSMQFGYYATWVGLQRMHRLGKLDFTPPTTVEGLQDCADIDIPEAQDPEGKGSGQAPVTG